MRNNKNKGFTLVELLVVIAILAILATVSVVGYTSFIESATVSNDENIAAQLNNFLVAMKADHTGKYYGEEIDENNIREVTDYILQDSGLEELVPQAEKYGYHFYYDLEEDKYVVMKDADVNVSAMNIILNAFADEGSTYEVKLENSFTQGNRYFFVGTPSETSPLSLIVDAFYNFDSTKYTDLDKMVTDLANVGLSAYVKDLVIVTENYNYRLSSTPKYVLFVEGVKSIGTTTKEWNGSAWGDPATADSLATVTGTLTIPNSLEFLAKDSLNIGANGTLVINKPVSAVVKMACENFTDTKVTLKDGVYYTADNGVAGGANADRAVIYNDSVELPFEYYNPAASYDIAVEENGELVHNSTTGFANVAVEAGTFVLSSTNFVGSIYPHLPSSTTSSDVEWTLADGSKENDYVKINGSVVTIKDVTTEGIQFVAKLDGVENKTYTVYLGYISAGNVMLFDDTLTVATTANLTLVKTPTTNKYTIDKAGDYTYQNNDGITLNEAITWTYSGTGTKATSGNTEIELTGKGSGVLTIKVGSYLTFTVNLTIEDTENFALQPLNNNNFTYLGSKDEVYLSDFFTLNGELPEGAELVVFAGGAYTGDTYMTPNRTELQTSGNGVSIETSATYSLNSVSTNEDLKNIEFKFVGEDKNNAIRIAVMHNGVRISEDIIVKVVDAYNIRTYADLLNATIEKTVTETISYPNKVTKSADLKSQKLDWVEDEADANNVAGYVIDWTESDGTWTKKIFTGDNTTGGCDPSTKWYYIELTYSKTTKSSTSTNTDKSSIVLLNNIIMLDTNIATTTVTKAYDDYEFVLKSGGDATNPNDYVKTIIANSHHDQVTSEVVTTIEDGYLDIPAGATFYGNGFTFDISQNGRDKQEGIINLSGTLRDVKITGAIYPETAYSVSNQYGSASVRASSGAKIENCYISNSRSPLRVQGGTGTITIKDTVLFGGRYCNVDMISGTLKIQGTVVTVQTPVKYDDDTTVLGAGIVCHYGDSVKSVTVDTGASFKQYNFVTYSQSSILPSVELSGTKLVDITAVINNSFTDSQWDSMIYDKTVNDDGSYGGYANTGIISLEKYITNPDNLSISTVETKDGDAVTGATVTVAVNRKHYTTMYTLVWDSSVYKLAETDKNGNITYDTTGKKTFTHAGSKSVVSEAGTIGTHTLVLIEGATADTTSITLQAVEVLGGSSVPNSYVRQEYPQTITDAQWTLLELACSVAGSAPEIKGLSNKDMITDWWATNNEHKTEYNEFLSDGFTGYYGTTGQSGEGEYEFVNGRIHFYTLPAGN